METGAEWTEKWAKYRREFEAEIPDGESVQKRMKYGVRWGDGVRMSESEAIAAIREGRRKFMDFAERLIGLSDSELLERWRSTWYVNCWLQCTRLADLNDIARCQHILASRGYNTHALEVRLYSDAEAGVRADVDEIIADGGETAAAAREVLAEATDKKTGAVDWAAVDYNLAGCREERRRTGSVV